MAPPTTSILFSDSDPAAPSGDQVATPQTDATSFPPFQFVDFIPKKATSSLRGVVKPDNSTITVASDGTISAGAPAGMATQAAVQDESYIYAADTGSANAYAVALSPAPSIVAGSIVVFKAVNANTGASTLAVNGGSATAIYKQVSTPLSSGDILAGQIVTVVYDGTHWQIGATGAIPAGTLAPALRGTAGGSGTTGSSFAVTWPAGTLAGDLVVICCNHDYNLTCPSGWTQNDLTNGNTWNGMFCSKVMTSGDITAGSVTISAAGSQDWAYIATAFIGATGGIRETDTRWDAGTGTRTVTTSSAVQATDAGLYFGSGRGAGTALSISRGVSEDTVTGTNSQSDLNAESLSAGGSYSVNFAYTVGAGSGAYSAVVIVEGVPLAAVVTSLNGLTGALTLIAGSNVTITPSGSGITIAASGGGGGGVSSVGLTVPSRQSVSGSPVTGSGTLAITDNTQSANEVFAGPASGSAAAPTFRALVPADLPVGSASQLGALQVDGTTIVETAGVISATAALSNPMTTEGDIIYGGASGAPTRLAAGTSGQVLQTNGSGAAPSWAAGGGGGSGALILLEEHTASSSAELDFTASISSTYDEYVVELINLQAATSGANIQVQFSTNGGSSYDTSSIYSWGQMNTSLNSGGAGENFASSVGAITLWATTGGGLPTSANPAFNASFKLFAPGSTSQYKTIMGQGLAIYSGNSAPYLFQFGGFYANNAAVNALRIIMSSGNIASGTVRIYGLTH